MPNRCQECGKEVADFDERHCLEDCGNYHLKRAVEILGIKKVLKYLWEHI